MNFNTYHNYKPKKEFNKKVAYFSMEFGIHQSLKIYSGGLGYLAGSHMRSGYELRQNMIGIGMLWKYGYFDQKREANQNMRVDFIEKQYSFLEDSGIEVEVPIFGNPGVKVRAYVLRPEVFGTVPMFFLTTDVEGNDDLSRSITNNLYAANELTRVAQSIVLGIGGAKVVEALGGADIYHLNEGHGLPAFYYLKDQGYTKENMVFTTHTPETAGNEERDIHHLNDAGFFGRPLSWEELEQEAVNGNRLNYTVAALRHAKKANAVSKLHAEVAQEMWKDYSNCCEIIPITNAQNLNFWQDADMNKAWDKESSRVLKRRKIELKTELFKEVLEQTGKIMDPDVMTIVWARRFAGYKRADILLGDMERFNRLVNNTEHPVQIIWAGKPYPMDGYGIDIFNKLVQATKPYANLAVLTGYEMELSRKLKGGSDVWLNTPRITHEASGTSGMTAAMNGSINVTVNDGWIPEFGKHGVNSFVLPEAGHDWSDEQMDNFDRDNLYKMLEQEVLPTYYDKPKQWVEIAFRAMDNVIPEFTSARMATEYYKKLYTA